MQTGAVTVLPDRQWREDAPSPYGWLGGLAWKGDASQLAFDVAFDGHPRRLLVADFDGTAHTATAPVPLPSPYTLTGDTAWWDGDLCFTVSDRARLRLVCRDGRDRLSVITDQDDAVVWDWKPAGSGVVALMAPSDALPELVALRGRRITPLLSLIHI